MFEESERERERESKGERMWHEARKQEKKIRDAMVDFQRRAERRREHYEKMVRERGRGGGGGGGIDIIASVSNNIYGRGEGRKGRLAE